MKSICIVDDDLQICETIRMALSPLGHKITVCMTGQEALDCVEEEAPQVLILDIMLPDINGIDVLNKIRATESGKKIPVIMMTALGSQHDVHDECSAFLRKPFDLDALVDKVEIFIARA